MSIETDRLMALVQTRRQGLKQDSLTSIVSTSGGSVGVAVETAACARAVLAAWLHARGSGVALNRTLLLAKRYQQR
jgi:hypothetical protein